jgi:hypothetical protein
VLMLATCSRMAIAVGCGSLSFLSSLGTLP